MPRDPLPLVAGPESGPTSMQARLAAQAPAPAIAGTAAAAKLDRALDAFDAKLGGRRGYLAVDKPLYQPGETIWYRLFDLTAAELGSAEPAALKVQLIGPRGTVVTERVAATGERGAGGDFVLAPDLAGGEYILRAHVGDRITERRVVVSSYEPPRMKKVLELTRKAYGPGDAVVATVALHRATGEPLAGKKAVGVVALDGAELARVPVTTDDRGNAVVKFELPAKIAKGDGLVMVIVEDGGVAESVQKRIPITLADVSVSLYPEGGELVAGVPGRVYFAARTALDKPADIEGQVVDERGEVVARVRTLHGGLGRFELVPRKGKLTLQVTRPAGIAKKFPLPAARDEGCALQAVDDFTSAKADLRVAVACSSARKVVVTGVLRERRVGTVAVQVPDGAPAVISLPVPAGAQGAVRVTAFDEELAPLAERLVYRARGKDLAITIRPDRTAYHPRDRAALAIETRGPDGKPVAADLAVSVVDDTVLAFADDKKATLLARMYLEAELPDQKIDEPNFYFGDDPKAPAALDLVMGTHGWRRFEWKPVFATPLPPLDDRWTFDGDLRAKPARAVAAAPKAPTAVAKKEEADAAPPPDGKPRQAVAKAGEAIVIGGKAPVIDPTSTTQGLTIDKDYIRNIPMPARTFEAALGAAAGMQGDGFGVAFAGATSLENVYYVDGVNTTGLQFGSAGVRYGYHVIRGPRRKAPPVAQVEACCFQPERVFPQPAYAARYDGPRTDFRETVYWNGRVATDARGKGTVEFVLSDAVTSFRATAEGVGGGAIGRATAQLASKKPVSLAVKLPTEVTTGDRLKLPITIANETAEPYDAAIRTKIGGAFRVVGDPLPGKLALAAHERRSAFLELDVVGGGDSELAVAVEAAHLSDTVERTVRVVANGFPMVANLAGKLTETARHELLVGDIVPGSLTGTLTFYPSPVATMLRASEAVIAEPSGCFEQASTSTYPNAMVLGLLEAQGDPDAAIVAKAQGALARGYKLLTGYETKTRGYEWFGGDPGHEALTAYGLMEFRDMARVFGDVDGDMIDRTRAWLRSRRDGSGGYQTSAKSLDHFGRASKEVTDAYITYALVEAGEKDLDAELAKQRATAAETKDPYLLALSTKVLVAAQPKAPTTGAAITRLAELQDKDGSWKGADHSITRSGGIALEIETTALAALALMGSKDHEPAVERAVQWLDKQRGGDGRYSSTQATILTLKALLGYANASRRADTGGALDITVNGVALPRVTWEKGRRGTIDVDLRKQVRPGKNLISIAQVSGSPIPYAGALAWTSTVPATSPATAVRLETAFAKTSTRLGEAVHADVTVKNTTDKGVPMTVARVGLPGGLAFQTWQLQELRDKKLIDYYETRPREVILYFRALGPKESRVLPLELLAQSPGTYVAPASRAYLYYTDELVHWVPPATVTIAP
ncbi:MAG: hypothetical protein KIT31_26985 [Deltaproteobacteria bacterium]|nr:hypothetical protein [Deltaproteobacteria bacterium]